MSMKAEEGVVDDKKFNLGWESDSQMETDEQQEEREEEERRLFMEELRKKRAEDEAAVEKAAKEEKLKEQFGRVFASDIGQAGDVDHTVRFDFLMGNGQNAPHVLLPQASRSTILIKS